MPAKNKFQTRVKKVTAIQWKGWPHKIKGIEQHIYYPQLAQLEGDTQCKEIYPDYWIVTHSDGAKEALHDWDFKKLYVKPRKKSAKEQAEAFKNLFLVMDALSTFHRHSPVWATMKANEKLEAARKILE